VEPIGSGPGAVEEKEVTFDNVQELGEFLRKNRWIAEKVGYGKKTPCRRQNFH